MVTPELLNFIRGELQKGRNPNEVAASLTAHGWSEEDVTAAFNALGYRTKTITDSVATPSSGEVNINPRLYPTLVLERIANPSRLWAIPILGALVKAVILFPVFSAIGIFFIYIILISAINSFIVLFSGKYWNYFFKTNLEFLKLLARSTFFFDGLTNTYPAFVKDNSLSIDISYPNQPNRLLAIPLVGFLIRFFILIPFLIYSNILKNAANIGVFIFSWVPVLLFKRYPESTFELARDSMRINLATISFLTGLSDKYPSFRISMNHWRIKVALIIIPLLIIYVLPPLSTALLISLNPSNQGNGYFSENVPKYSDVINGQVYVNKKEGFKITIPQDWSFVESFTTPAVTFWNVPKDGGTATASIDFYSEPVQGADLDTYTAGREDYLKSLGFKEDSKSKLSINGAEAYLIYYSSSTDDKRMLLITVNNGKVYELTAYAAGEDRNTLIENWNKYKDVLKESLYSFEFIKN